MKKLIGLFIVIGLFSTGCGLQQDLSRECGGELELLCQGLFGRDGQELEEVKGRLLTLEQGFSALSVDMYHMEQMLLENDEANLDLLEKEIDLLELEMQSLVISMGLLESKSIQAIVDPCGDSPYYDEVLVQLGDGRFIAYFQDGGKRFLTVLDDGHFRTTDRQRCNFSITNGVYSE